MASVNSNTPNMLNSEDSSCLPNLILFIIIVFIIYYTLVMLFQKPNCGNDDNDSVYVLYGVYN